MIFNIQIDNGVNTKDGTATESDILNGKIAYVGKEKIVGSMKDNGDVDSAIVNGVLQEGYTSGGAIKNLSSENIRDGVVIGGKTGNYKGVGYTGKLRINYFDTYNGGGDNLQLKNLKGQVLLNSTQIKEYWNSGVTVDIIGGYIELTGTRPRMNVTTPSGYKKYTLYENSGEVVYSFLKA